MLHLSFFVPTRLYEHILQQLQEGVRLLGRPHSSVQGHEIDLAAAGRTNASEEHLQRKSEPASLIFFPVITF